MVSEGKDHKPRIEYNLFPSRLALGLVSKGGYTDGEEDVPSDRDAERRRRGVGSGIEVLNLRKMG